MFKGYYKAMGVVFVVLFWLWATTNSFAALSARSDLGVVVGLGGLVTSTFVSVWVLILIFKKREKHDEKVSSGSDSRTSGPHV